MPKNEILSYEELGRYLELAGSLKRVMSQEMRGQIERGPQLKEAFSLIRQAEESIREEMREVRYALLKKSWKPVTPEYEMEKPEKIDWSKVMEGKPEPLSMPETPETPMRFRAPNEDEIRRQLEKARTDGEREYWKTQLEARSWQDEGPGPLDIREG